MDSSHYAIRLSESDVTIETQEAQFFINSWTNDKLTNYQIYKCQNKVGNTQGTLSRMQGFFMMNNMLIV